MSTRSLVLRLAAAGALCVAGCDQISALAGKSAGGAAAETQPQAAPLTPSGPPAALTAAPADAMQAEASVVRVDSIPGESAKLFGTAGGDPAMNGLQTYIAFFASPAEGWSVYQIGDFLDYTVLSHAVGRVDLDVQESVMDPASGAISDQHRKIIVQWTQGADDTVPTAVSVTPAD